MEKSTTNIPQLGNTGIYNSSISFFLSFSSLNWYFEFFYRDGVNLVNEILLTADEAIDYIKNEVQINDTLELSYNRIFAPGEVLSIIDADEETGEGIRVNLQLNGEILNQSVEIDLNEIRDDLLEVRHIKDGELTVIEIDFD